MAILGKASYTGFFRHTLDDKNRITIPSAWRAAHAEGETFLATPHPDGYIAILPPAEVEKLHAKFAQVPLSDGSAQDFAARFFSRTQALTFDKQGRMMLNAELLAFAGVEKEAVLVGSLTKFQLYSQERWAKVEQRTAGDNYGDLMRRIGI
jgi:MraZ protein